MSSLKLSASCFRFPLCPWTRSSPATRILRYRAIVAFVILGFFDDSAAFGRLAIDLGFVVVSVRRMIGIRKFGGYSLGFLLAFRGVFSELIG